MNISFRETLLAWATLALVLFGGTYLLGGAKFKEWKSLQEAETEVNKEILLAERMIGQRASWNQQLGENMVELRAYPEGQEVAPQLLKELEQTARTASLNLTSRTPEKETAYGEIHEQSIKCSFEGNLEAIVRFLYAVQVKGAMYDIRSLTVQPTGKGGLRGSFAVDCAFTRGQVTPEPALRVEPVAAPDIPAAPDTPGEGQ